MTPSPANRKLAEKIAYEIFEARTDILYSPEVLADFIFQILQEEEDK